MRVWFNHWFSTAYHLINLIKEGDPGKFTVIGSSVNSSAIYQRACEEWYVEPDNLTQDEYSSFCLDFCRKHNIDIFVPRRNMVSLVQHHAEFSALGVKLLADLDADKLALLENKRRTYVFFQSKGFSCIPEIRIAHSLDEFNVAYAELKSVSSRVCYKLLIDEGARSFRVVDNQIEQPSAILEKPGTKITLAAAQKVLGGYDFSIPVLLMPYLSGVEISVDSIATPTGNLIIPRYKMSKRYSEVIFSQEVMNLCGEMMNLLGIKMPVNIQLKKEQDKLYLLEINPRMSGGLQLSCKASRINLPNIAINQLLGIEKPWIYPKYERQKILHIETPICLY